MHSADSRCAGRFLASMAAALLLAAVGFLLGAAPAAAFPGAPGAKLAGQGPPELSGNPGMRAFLSRTVQQLEQATATGLPQLPQIGTFNGWCFWMGWEGSFSETYAPDSEAYDWVVYFAPEGIYLALQSSKSHYSGVDVNYGLSNFFGALVSPDGNVVTRSYINSLMGVSVTLNTPFNLVPYGPMANLAISQGIGPTFFRIGTSKTLQRAIQFNAGFTVAYELVPLPLPGQVSLNYESTFNNGFYPTVTWTLDPMVPNPINAIVAGLQTLKASQGKTLVEKIYREMAKMLVPFLSKLQTNGPVVLKDNVKPLSPAQYFGNFLQNHSLTVPAASPNTSIDYLIKRAEKWLASGWIPEGIFAEASFPIDLRQLAEETKPIKPSTDLAFEGGYQLVYDTSSNTISTNCLIEVNATPGKPCSITITANEIAALVPGSKPEDFEGVEVVFTNSPEEFLKSGYSATAVPVESGLAVYEFTQYSDTPFVVAVQISPTAATGNKKINLCRRVVTFNRSNSLTPVVELLLVPNPARNGRVGVLTRRHGRLTLCR